jgi:hypothetical protein
LISTAATAGGESKQQSKAGQMVSHSNLLYEPRGALNDNFVKYDTRRKLFVYNNFGLGLGGAQHQQVQMARRNCQ